MNTLPNDTHGPQSTTPTVGARPRTPRDEIEHLATTAVLIDDAVVALRAQCEALNVAWSQMRRQLASRVIWLIWDDDLEAFTLSENVRSALGGNFAEGVLWQAAMEEGLLRRIKAGEQPSETPEGAGILAAITRVTS